MRVQMQACMKPECTAPQTLRCEQCRGAFYCSLLHQIQDYSRPGVTECAVAGFQRPCVRCARKTTLACDRCEETYSEVLQAPVAEGAVMTGRALCSQCDEKFDWCEECEVEYLPQYEHQPQPR